MAEGSDIGNRDDKADTEVCPDCSRKEVPCEEMPVVPRLPASNSTRPRCPHRLPERLPVMKEIKDRNDGNQVDNQPPVEVVSQAVAHMLMEESEVRRLTKTVKDMERKVEAEKKRGLECEAHLIHRKGKEEAAQKLVQEAVAAARHVNSILKDINRSLDEGDKRLEWMKNKEKQIREVIIIYEAQKDEVKDLEKLLSTHQKNTAHMEGLIVTESKYAITAKKQMDEASHDLKIIREKYYKKRKLEMEQLNESFSSQWENVAKSITLYDELLGLTRPEIEALQKTQPVMESNTPESPVPAATTQNQLSE